MKKHKTSSTYTSQEKKNMLTIVVSIISIILSIFSLILSFWMYISYQDSKPLSFYAKPTITNATNNVIDWNLEFVVTNGAIGDVRFFDYRDGNIQYMANNVGGIIRKGDDKQSSTFSFEINYEPMDKFLATTYVLVNGKDGSKELGMILFHISYGENIHVKYYSQEDITFAEMDLDQQIYSKALADYRDVLTKLREAGEI